VAKNRGPILALVCTLFLGLLPAQAWGGQQLLVKFRSGSTRAEREAVLAQAGVVSLRTLEALGVHVVVPRARPQKATKVLRSSRYVAYVEPDLLVRSADTVPNDAAWIDQWGIRKIGAPRAWDSSRGSPAIIVAVLDTGVDFTHLDLRALVPGYDFVNRDVDPADDQGHGTATAGVVGALTNNTFGTAGACWHCSLMPLKVLDASGTGAHSTIAEAIVWAADKGAKVVNLSLGSPGATKTLGDAVAYAVGKGVVVVAAAGNSSSSTPFYPAAYPGVISVAGTDANDRLYSWSNFGPWVKVAAPGCNAAPALGGGYSTFCGTSSSSPLVAGLAGLALAAQPLASPVEVEQALMRSATPLPGYVSYGRVNAPALLSELGGITPVAPASTSIDPERQFQGAPTFAVAWSAPAAVSYDVRFRRAGPKDAYDPYVVWQAGATATGADFRASPGSTYCFSTSVKDATAVPRPWGAEACTAVPLDDSSFRKRGLWKRKSGPGYYLGTFSVATKRGATLSLAGLEARRLALVATRCRGCGVVDVLLDGKRLKRINLASRSLHKLQVIQIASFPGVRHGTVLLRVTSSGKPVRIEGLGVSRA
jgi:subtilisin family serine protease